MNQSSWVTRAVAAVTMLLVFADARMLRAHETGQPDLSGTWTLLRHDRPGGRFGSPANPELTPAGKAMVEEFERRYNVATEEPGAHCVPAGMPTTMFGLGGYPMEFTQNSERLTIFAEIESQYRRIFLDGRAHPADYPATRTGHSVGHWEREGDTGVLVIETALIREWLVDRWPHSDQVRIVERMALRRPGEIDLGATRIDRAKLGDWVIENRITVIDPVMYLESATVTAYYRRVDDHEMLEYDCIEGNWRALLEQQANP